MAPQFGRAPERQLVYPYPGGLPFPLGNGWLIVPCAPGSGWVDLVKKIMAVPIDDSVYSYAIRNHEMGHAAWSTGVPSELAVRYSTCVETLNKTEDCRIQRKLTKEAGIDLSHGFVEPEVAREGVSSLLRRGAYRDVTLALVSSAYSGTAGVLREVVESWASHDPDAVECLRLNDTVLLRIAGDSSQDQACQCAGWLDSQFRLLGWVERPGKGQNDGTKGSSKPGSRDRHRNRDRAGAGGGGGGHDACDRPSQESYRPLQETWSTLKAEAASSEAQKHKSAPQASAEAILQGMEANQPLGLQIEHLTAAELVVLADALPGLILDCASSDAHLLRRLRHRLQADHVPWGRLRIERPALYPTSRRGLVKRWRATDSGGVYRYAHRLYTDGKAFADLIRAAGGLVLLDGSGSMGWARGQVAEFVEAAPGVTVAFYCGIKDEGILKVIAKDGRIASKSECIPRHTGNVVDLPALRWAASQRHKISRGPILWVSDGLVTASGEAVAASNIEEVETFIRKNRITRVGTCEEALELLRRRRS